jgi:hypothetical protein
MFQVPEVEAAFGRRCTDVGLREMPSAWLSVPDCAG